MCASKSGGGMFAVGAVDVNGVTSSPATIAHFMSILTA
jgi:hypothetical protein